MKEQYDRQKENAKYQLEMLSYLINDASIYIKSIDIIRPEMFTGKNRQIFDSIVSLIRENKKPDVTNISRKANIPLDEVFEIGTYFSGAGIGIDSLLYELYQYMAHEKYIHLAQFMANQVTAGTESETIKEHILTELRKLDFGSSSNVVTMEEGVSRIYRIIENNRKSVNCTGVPVGLNIIDKHMGGLHPGDLIVLAGEISHAKTSLALSMLYNSAVLFGEKCGIISHEMTPEQLTARVTAIATGISAKHILTGKFSDSEVHTFGSKVTGLIKSNLFVHEFIKKDIEDTVAAIRLMVMQFGIKWVVVENAGNITVAGIKRDNDEARTAIISKTLKSIAIELNITVILISHLNRDGGAKKQPELHRLKHSGQLESDADVVMFIYRPELHGYSTFNEADKDDIVDSCESRCKVYIAKGRNYGLCTSFPDFNHNTLYVSDNNENVKKDYELNANKNFEYEPSF